MKKWNYAKIKQAGAAKLEVALGIYPTIESLGVMKIKNENIK